MQEYKELERLVKNKIPEFSYEFTYGMDYRFKESHIDITVRSNVCESSHVSCRTNWGMYIGEEDDVCLLAMYAVVNKVEIPQWIENSIILGRSQYLPLYIAKKEQMAKALK